jgi:ribosomal protein L37AE/L43A
MRVRLCPQCDKATLVATGAFWSCESCRYAITTAALAKEQAQYGERAGDKS